MTVQTMPQLDDPQSASVSAWTISGGGPVATAMAALGRWGVPAVYVGVLGDDMAGRRIRAAFVEGGVDVSRLRHRSEMRSPVSLVLVEEETGRRAFLSLRDLDPGFGLTPSDRRLIQEASFLHLDGWYPTLGIAAAEVARRAGVTVSLDGYRVDERTPEWVSLTDVLIATETFPERFTGEGELEKACEELLRRGPELVVTTLGERGCYVKTQDRQFYSRGFQVDVVDTTGCGDVFHGAFLYGLLQEWPLTRVARLSNAAGALTARGLGGRDGIPSLRELDSFLARRSETS